MRNLPSLLKGYFYNTRNERNASIAMTFLSAVLFSLPSFYPRIFPPAPPSDFSSFRETILSVTSERAIAENSSSGLQPNFRNNHPMAAPVELFKFDPNKATKEELVRLGLSLRTAQTLLNYRSKGGRFFKKADLKKVYGLRIEDFERLEDWIVLEEEEQVHYNGKEEEKPTALAVSEEEISGVPKPVFEKKEYTSVIIDINEATEEEWQQLRGVGPYYSKKIVNFRDYLGGFVSIDQVATTKGLPDSTFQKIRPYLASSPIIRKIAINQYNLEDLKRHPYISSYQATILFNYRKQHGKFVGMDDLRKIQAGFEEKDFERLEAYLSFE